MRLSDEMPMDPDVLAELEVIDLTLAGEPVDPEYAELAELALMLQMERSQPSAEFARLLDARADRRFVSVAPAAGGGARTGGPARWGWLQSPGFRAGLVGICAAAAITVFAVGNLGGGSSGPATTAGLNAAQSPSGVSGAGGVSGATGVSSASTAASAASTTPQRTAAHGSAKTSGNPSAGNTYGSLSGSSASAPTLAPAPDTAGRKVIQSAQLTLSAGNDRIDAVSQEVFDVVSQEHGIVQNSHITSVAGRNGGTASFSLSIPTGNLEATLQSLSTLRYAHVVSRTNTTQDVTRTYRSDQQRLQDAEALRTSLLKQLAQATTQIQIDSLKAQVRDAEAQISSAQYNLRQLQHQVSYSSLSVQLYSGNPPIVRPAHHSGGFTLGGAAHDAGRVLVVAAGVILIGAAALLPVALLAALILWVIESLRRRRREQALDQT